MVIYELWDERTGRAIGRWPTEAEALATVCDLLDRGEVLTVAALVLRSADWGHAPTIITSGAELCTRARQRQ